MMGLVLLWTLFAALVVVAIRRADRSLIKGYDRAVEQMAKLVPRLLCALVAAGFVARLIPAEYISHFLGDGAGATAVLVGALVGLMIPAGPVIAFSIAAVFARAGASYPALVAFITSWSLFAAHRIFIYEIPLLGGSFTRMRLISVAALPFVAGALALALTLFVHITVAGRP